MNVVFNYSVDGKLFNTFNVFAFDNRVFTRQIFDDFFTRKLITLLQKDEVVWQNAHLL
jgi:hypothetical protein